MALWIAILYLTLGVWLTVSALRLTGAAGRERLLRRPEIRVKATYATYRSDDLSTRPAFGVVVTLVGLLLSALDGWLLGVLLWSGATLSIVVAILAGRRARPDVLAAFEASGLEPFPEETSERRSRLTRRLGITVSAGFVVMQVGSYLSEREASGASAVAALTGAAVLLVGGVWLVFAQAWRYGDERPR